MQAEQAMRFKIVKSVPPWPLLQFLSPVPASNSCSDSPDSPQWWAVDWELYTEISPFLPRVLLTVMFITSINSKTQYGTERRMLQRVGKYQLCMSPRTCLVPAVVCLHTHLHMCVKTRMCITHTHMCVYHMYNVWSLYSHSHSVMNKNWSFWSSRE